MKTLLNGREIPYGLPREQLLTMLHGADMTNFCLACEALSAEGSAEAFGNILSFSSHRDRYRRLFAFKTALRMPQAETYDWTELLSRTLLSDDLLFVKAALEAPALSAVPEETVCAAFARYGEALGDELHVLEKLERSEKNYTFLTALFRQTSTCKSEEILAEILKEKYADGHGGELFSLFSASNYGKIRIAAMRIAKERQIDFSKFSADPDGHVRKAYSKLAHTSN